MMPAPGTPTHAPRIQTPAPWRTVRPTGKEEHDPLLGMGREDRRAGDRGRRRGPAPQDRRRRGAGPPVAAPPVGLLRRLVLAAAGYFLFWPGRESGWVVRPIQGVG